MFVTQKRIDVRFESNGKSTCYNAENQPLDWTFQDAVIHSQCPF